MVIIYVEGDADNKFIHDIWKYIGRPEKLEIKGKKGIDKLLQLGTDIERDSVSNTVAVIIDANKNTANREIQLKKLQKESGVKFPYFLLPNDKDKGNLETLLLAMCRDERPTECFTQYKKCIKDKKLPHSPDKKAEIYAYCQMLSGAEKAKETERDYTDEKLWNLDTPKLQPLKKFLAGL